MACLPTTPNAQPAAWSAVFALTLCVSTLIASEFMPVSLLTPIAHDLHLSEGTAGQAIAMSGLFAVLTSLFIAQGSAGVDRRHLLMGLTALMGLSGVVVAMAPNFLVLMVGRAMLGVVIGGFWSLSAGTVMRLVPPTDVPRALALLNGGNALATTVAAPMGSYLGQYIGWRGAFFIVVPLAGVTLAWKYVGLPSLPAPRRGQQASSFGAQALAGCCATGLAIRPLFLPPPFCWLLRAYWGWRAFPNLPILEKTHENRDFVSQRLWPHRPACAMCGAGR
jgi:predicted MFS family arabinose efflux permease